MEKYMTNSGIMPISKSNHITLNNNNISEAQYENTLQSQIVQLKRTEDLENKGYQKLFYKNVRPNESYLIIFDQQSPLLVLGLLKNCM